MLYVIILNCAYNVESAVICQFLFASVQPLTLACTVLSAAITFVPPLAAVHHPVNVYPVFVAVGNVPAVVFCAPVYTAVTPFFVYSGLVPLIVPLLLDTLNVIFALFIA